MFVILNAVKDLIGCFKATDKVRIRFLAALGMTTGALGMTAESIWRQRSGPFSVSFASLLSSRAEPYAIRAEGKLREARDLCDRDSKFEVAITEIPRCARNDSWGARNDSGGARNDGGGAWNDSGGARNDSGGYLETAERPF